MSNHIGVSRGPKIVFLVALGQRPRPLQMGTCLSPINICPDTGHELFAKTGRVGETVCMLGSLLSCLFYSVARVILPRFGK